MQLTSEFIIGLQLVALSPVDQLAGTARNNTMSTVILVDGCSLLGKIDRLHDGARPVHSFRGIPYAQPPIGERRFQPPKPVQLWQGERQAVEFGMY